MAKPTQKVTVTEQIVGKVKKIITKDENNNIIDIKVVTPPAGGGGGGGGNNNSGDEEDKQNQSKEKRSPSIYFANTEDERQAASRVGSFTEQFKLTGVRAASSSLLLVEGAKEREDGIIKLRCRPDLLAREQKDELDKIIERVTTEFNGFKKEKGISGGGLVVKKDEQGNFLHLSITLPTPKLTNEFMQRLVKIGLLAPIPGKNTKDEEKEMNRQHMRPNPFKMQLRRE